MNNKATALARKNIARRTEILRPRLEETDALVRRKGKAGVPIPVYTPDGRDLVSWFVGVTVGDRIASFLQFDDRGMLIRHSSFQKDTRYVEGCPSADMWLKSSHAKNRAKSLAGRDALVKRSYLSYHQNITRLAWVVQVTDKDGAERRIYVSGDSVFE